jgi:hypothetical protein
VKIRWAVRRSVSVEVTNALEDSHRVEWVSGDGLILSFENETILVQGLILWEWN